MSTYFVNYPETTADTFSKYYLIVENIEYTFLILQGLILFYRASDKVNVIIKLPYRL